MISHLNSNIHMNKHNFWHHKINNKLMGKSLIENLLIYHRYKKFLKLTIMINQEEEKKFK
jgi:hypothetical protein